MENHKDIEREYSALWLTAAIDKDTEMQARSWARTALSARPLYDPISKGTGVPWFIVAILHKLQCNGDIGRRLADGLPRREGTFEQDAIAAIKASEIGGHVSWPFWRILWAMEKFNGADFGYRAHGIHSPYLWAGTSAYETGVFVQPGVFSRTIPARWRLGAAVLLRALVSVDEKCLDCDLPRPGHASSAPVKTCAEPAKEYAHLAGSGTIWSASVAAILVAVRHLEASFGILPQFAVDQGSIVAPLQTLANAVKDRFDIVSGAIILVLLAVVIVRHARDKQQLRRALKCSPT